MFQKLLQMLAYVFVGGWLLGLLGGCSQLIKHNGEWGVEQATSVKIVWETKAPPGEAGELTFEFPSVEEMLMQASKSDTADGDGN